MGSDEGQPRSRRSIDFASLARRAIIWAVFFALLYFLRAFFPFLLLTFVITYAVGRAVTVLSRRHPRWPRRLLVTLVFVGGVGAFTGLGFLVGPLILSEQRNFVQRFPETRESIARWLEDARRDQPILLQTLDPEGSLVQEVRSFELKDLRGRPSEDQQEAMPLLEDVSPIVLDFARIAVRIVSTILLSLLFSFLILLDLPKLRAEVEAIRSSRVGWLYQEVRGTVVEFGTALGRMLESQVVIAGVNTILTFLGLTLLGVPSKFLLSMIVFICSFIPVLGVFIST
ncbi:MAG: AI-2E family transporter, partial [Deltaproteobacteria bacterium]|nr:AI-2E family transporter [Deltaproteobacteria bacterium]